MSVQILIMRHLHLFDAVTERSCLPHRQIVARHLYHNQPIRPAAAFTFMHIRLFHHQLHQFIFYPGILVGGIVVLLAYITFRTRSRS